METLHTQFSQALSNIEISDAKRRCAVAAHTEIQGTLASDKALRDWGINTRLIGSYSRQTAIHPGKDVDVFARLEGLDTSANPEAVYQQVWDVLRARYGSRATPQARSVKVEFPSGTGADASFAVDAVPAVRSGSRWAIPAKQRSLWADSPSRWIVTDPERFGELSSDLNTAAWSPTVRGQDAYKPVVKLMRQVRETHLGDRKPGGLYIEFATYDVWNSRVVRGSEWCQLLAVTLGAVASRFAAAPMKPIVDPGLGTPVDPALDAAVWRSAAQTIGRLAELAEVALSADRCAAAAKWREILGKNARGQVLPLPPGCDARGFATTGMAGLAASRPREAEGFG